MYQLVRIAIQLKQTLCIHEIDAVEYIHNGTYYGEKLLNENDLHTWVINTLKFTEERKPGSPDDVPRYLFRLFSIMYRSLSDSGEVMILENCRQIIDSSIIAGLYLYSLLVI